MEKEEKEGTGGGTEFRKVYVPRWGLTKAVIPCHCSYCEHNATVVGVDSRVSSRGVCLLGLHTGRFESMTQCKERWDDDTLKEYLKAYART